jgi:hypothetical protein
MNQNIVKEDYKGLGCGKGKEGGVVFHCSLQTSFVWTIQTPTTAMLEQTATSFLLEGNENTPTIRLVFLLGCRFGGFFYSEINGLGIW